MAEAEAEEREDEVMAEFEREELVRQPLLLVEGAGGEEGESRRHLFHSFYFLTLSEDGHPHHAALPGRCGQSGSPSSSMRAPTAAVKVAPRPSG